VYVDIVGGPRPSRVGERRNDAYKYSRKIPTRFKHYTR